MKEKLDKFIKGKGLMITLSLLGVYLITSGASWAFFSFVSTGGGMSSEDVGEARLRVDPNLPKDQACPINGKMYTKPEREIWETRRPMTAIIENHLDSRPQSGLSRADVVYEAVAEGGITRFLNVFYCGASAEDIKIAPIRSIRVYFINWAAEYSSNPILVHSGGANNICNNCPGGVKYRGQVDPTVDAFKELVDLGWRAPSGNAMDAGTNLGYPAVKRDQYRLGEKAAWEHSFEGYTDKIFEEAEKRGFGYQNEDGVDWDEDFVVWKFADDKALSSPKASKISFSFWDNKPDYDVVWTYDSQENKYLRENSGQPHKDHNSDTQLFAKNVVIQFVKELGPVDQEGHMNYVNIGEGDALIFQNGDVIKGSWEKEDQFARTIFSDEKGDEIEFVRGEIWIEAVPKGNDIDY